jgi:glycine/D-amino acid oxidase-like deaminating enzyme
METFDVLVVGAGIIGATCAHECVRAGLHTGIVECGVPAGGTTAAGMGHLVVMDDSPAQLALTSYSRSLWQEERHRLPASAEYENRGTIWIAGDNEEMAEVEAKHRTYAQAGVASRILDAAALAEEEPNLRSNLSGGLLVPEDGVIYPPTAAAFYLAEARSRGAHFFQARAVAARDGEVGIADGSTLHAHRIVLATGTECDLLPALPVKKRKGHLLITDRYPGFLRHQLVELGYLKSAHSTVDDSVAFNVQPRQTGQLLIGSSRQYNSGGPEVEPRMLRMMLERAVSYMPNLKSLSSLRVWTGFRASIADKLPLIGPALGLSDDPSLWLAVGFEGLGITNAPGAACLLVDLLLRRRSAIDPTPYLPARAAGLSVPHA